MYTNLSPVQNTREKFDKKRVTYFLSQVRMRMRIEERVIIVLREYSSLLASQWNVFYRFQFNVKPYKL